MTGAPPVQFAAVSQAALAVLPTLLARWLPGGRRQGAEYVALNPTRNDRRPGSFQINLRTGRWIDFATGSSLRDCDKGGDAVALYAYLYGLGQAAAARELADQLGLGDLGRARARTPATTAAVPDAAGERAKAARIGYAQRIWRRARPAAGTPVDVYLRGRGITLPPPASLRFAELLHPDDPSGLWPCMVGGMQAGPGRPGDPVVGVHRTYLDWQGRKAAFARVKLMLGQAEGAVVRLGPPGPGLILAEGIETALSALQLAPGWCVWAALSAGNLARVAIPAGVERLVIVADGDCKYDPATRVARRAGLRAAEAALAPLAGLGIAGSIVVPDDGLDLNDVLLREPDLARRFTEHLAAELPRPPARAA